MPIAFDPDSRVWFSLDGGPTEFCARPMTIRQVDQYDDDVETLRREADALPSRQLRAKVLAMLRERIIEWRNAPEGFQGLEDLTERELYMLFYRLPEMLSLNEADKKK